MAVFPKIASPDAEWQTAQKCAQITGLGHWWFRDRRLEGSFTEGAHYAKPPGTHGYLYNLPLVRDFIANGGNTLAHQAAVQTYLAGLPSSRVEAPKRGRPAKTPSAGSAA
jgi:hypothetical protein